MHRISSLWGKNKYDTLQKWAYKATSVTKQQVVARVADMIKSKGYPWNGKKSKSGLQQSRICSSVNALALLSSGRQKMQNDAGQEAAIVTSHGRTTILGLSTPR